ncbi:MAG: substrate-binding domain-containing protein [Phycisphaerae bacterium]|nr:substrate-binding domain-containing protein [Phycisphaerae bacterium]
MTGTKTKMKAVRLNGERGVPLYRQIEEHFSRLILSRQLQPGDRLPSVSAVMRELGVNTRTVCQAYQRLSDRGLVHAVNGKGTFVAEARAAIQSIVVLADHPVRHGSSEWSSFEQVLYDGVLKQARELELPCQFQVFWEEGLAGLERLRDCGVILFGGGAAMAPAAAGLVEREIRSVAISGWGNLLPLIRGDDGEGIRLVMEHLFELGHRRIAFINAPLDNFSVLRRQEAYQQMMAERGLPVLASWVSTAKSWCMNDSTEQDEMLDRMLSSPEPPTAIVNSGGYLAMAMLQGLHRRGVRVPQEVSVTAYDDSMAFELSSPALTTVRQPWEQIGREAVRKLVAVMEGQEVEDSLLPVELVVRESTGKAGNC